MKKGRMPFSILKFINIILIVLPFAVCWFAYYEPKTVTTNSKQVSVLLFCLLFIINYSLCFRMDGFRVSILQIRDIAFSQIIAIGVTDIIAYILIWMLSIHRPNILPGFICFSIQCLIAVGWAYIIHQCYFATHSPLPSIVIYDVRHGMEDLIYQYGLEKRFEILETWC